MPHRSLTHLLPIPLLALGAGAAGLFSAGPQRPAEPPPEAAGRAASAPAPEAGQPGPDFAGRVLPILKTACFECHARGRQSGRLRVDSRAALLQGGREGPAIVPGDPAASPLIQRMRGEGEDSPMPFERPLLPAEQVSAIAAWIAAGAPWPDDIVADGEPARKHWAYEPPVRPTPPPQHSELARTWVRSPIDRFILARLEREGLAPSPEAAPAVLLRRASLDLTGLPPTVAEVDAFLADDRPGAYERAVDRLLASPHFGERWAGPWLDLARYADSRGYEKDLAWTMWPFRDWVISAINADMPFDQFTIEQLAGDLLPGATVDQHVATGFHRCTMINEEGGTDPEEQRVNAVMDRAATTASVWLGSTLGCAQCHDHKYDPFTQRDYYRLFAFFNNSPAETRQTDRAEIEVVSPVIPLPDPSRPSLEAEAADLRMRLIALPPDASIERRAARARLSVIEARLALPRTAQVMRELPTPRVTHVLAKGSFLSPEEEVTPGVPEVLPPLPSPPSGAGSRADRLVLARWLVSPENPLTARVAVNRLWEACFGAGIVETSDDFGTRGSPPSHPELLDWLACEMVSTGWRQKAMLKLIVTSATYRQSSAISSEALERDPQNRLLARGPRFRLPGEMIRDQALAAGGILSRTVGGPPVFPPQPAGVWASPYSGEQWVESQGPDRRRRSVYTYWKRSSPHPAFTTFDAPQRQVSCARRSRSNTPLQALLTLNDPAFIEPAIGLAVVAMRSGGSDDERAALMFRRVLARAPEAPERARLVALFSAELARFQADGPAREALLGLFPVGRPTDLDPSSLAAWTIVANVVLNLDEALTKG